MSSAFALSTLPNSPSPNVCSIMSWDLGNSHFGSGYNKWINLRENERLMIDNVGISRLQLYVL